jgi:lipoate-protein ligase A
VPLGQLFDVEQYRRLTGRLARALQVDRPTLVLGSTQRADLVSRVRVEERGVDVVRRRGGGGSVLLMPGDHLWLDAWIPRHDPLWSSDVSAGAAWVGEWWGDALSGAGLTDLTVHRGRAQPGELGELVCLAGRGPGEVFSGGRKVVGLSQWRSREGALFMSCAYTQWRPEALTDLLHLDEPTRLAITDGVGPLAAGLDELAPAGVDLATLGQALLASFPSWGSDGSTLST